jgi:tetratricopeptide (TPR) repeat protein/DNA-binding CsgD family transcriptional regulator
MKIALFSCLIFILSPIFGLSQDKSDYDALVSKSKALLNENPQEALKIAKKAFIIAKPDKRGHANYQIANAFSYLDKLDSSGYYIDLAIKDCRKTANNKLLGSSLTHKAQNNIYLGKSDEVLPLFEEAKKLMEAEKDTNRLIDLYLRMGGFAIDQDRLADAMTEVEKCYELCMAKDDQVYASYALNDLCIIHTKLGNTEKGIEMAIKALELGEKLGDKFTAYQAQNNLGILYKNALQYNYSLEAYSKAEKLGIEINFKRGLMGVYANRGILLNLMKRYSEAKKEFDKALTLEKEIGVPIVKADIKINQANTYSNLGQNDMAINLVKEGLSIAKNLGSLELQLNGHKIAKEILLKSGDLKGAVLALETIQFLKDSIFTVEKTKQVNEFQTKYETVKKDAEIKDLNRKAEIQELRNKGLLGGLILLAISAFSITYSVLSKRKKDKLINEKEKALEIEKRKYAEKELEAKKKELTSKVLQLAKKNEFLSNLELEVDALKSNVDSSVNKSSGKIARMIRRDIANDTQWEQFDQEFSGIHKGFLQALTEEHGTFTKSEIRLISLLKMNLSSKEIAVILGISADGIKKARYRLRKKMNLEDSQIQSYILSFT